MAEDTEGQKFIRNFFEDHKTGYLIDVGAHAGEKYGSMSWELIQQGWGGLMVEPLPEAYKKLEKVYAKNPKVVTVQAACSNEIGKGILYPFKGVSTLSKEWAKECDQWWKHVRYKDPIEVRKTRLDVLLNQVSAPSHVDFLQVDTEGHDLFVLKGMDWNRGPELICVETLDMLHRERRRPNKIWNPSPELNIYMASLGYELVLLTPGGNGFYQRNKA